MSTARIVELLEEICQRLEAGGYVIPSASPSESPSESPSPSPSASPSE